MSPKSRRPGSGGPAGMTLIRQMSLHPHSAAKPSSYGFHLIKPAGCRADPVGMADATADYSRQQDLISNRRRGRYSPDAGFRVVSSIVPGDRPGYTASVRPGSYHEQVERTTEPCLERKQRGEQTPLIFSCAAGESKLAGFSGGSYQWLRQTPALGQHK